MCTWHANRILDTQLTCLSENAYVTLFFLCDIFFCLLYLPALCPFSLQNNHILNLTDYRPETEHRSHAHTTELPMRFQTEHNLHSAIVNSCSIPKIYNKVFFQRLNPRNMNLLTLYECCLSQAVLHLPFTTTFPPARVV